MPRITARSILLCGQETAHHGVEPFQRGLMACGAGSAARKQQNEGGAWQLDDGDGLGLGAELARVRDNDNAAHPAQVDCDVRRAFEVCSPGGRWLGALAGPVRAG